MTKLRLQLIIESDSGETEVLQEVAKLERHSLRPETLGLMLSEAKELLHEVANTNEVLYLVNRPGNVVSHEGCVPWIDRAIKLVAPHAAEITLRGDTDFTLSAELDRWDKQGIKFIFGMDAHPKVVNLAQALPEEAWKPLERLPRYVVDYKATAKNGEITLDHTRPGDEWKISYKRQMEIYIWLLRKQGFDVDDRGFFLYANGHEGEGFDRKVEFDVSLLPYVANCDWIEPILPRIKECLMQPSLPPAPNDCEFCGYVASLS